jgi:hypothetical protein
MTSKGLLCIVHGQGSDWEAICLDLDIAVTAGSIREAKETLRAAIRDYIVAAMQEDEPNRSALLARRAPLSVRLGWAFKIACAAMVGAIRGANTNDEETGQFVVPCRA